MLDACVITRASGPGVRDPETGLVTRADAVVIYSGKCKVKAPQTVVASVDAGEQQVTLVPGEVHIPIAGDGYRTDPETARAFIPTDDDEVVLSTLGATSDPALLGQVFSVTGPHLGSSTTARRLPVKAVV